MGMSPYQKQKAFKTLSSIHGWVCWYCGAPLTPGTAVPDHIKPRSEGGKDVVENLALSCNTCNCAKSDMSLKDFLSWLTRIRNGAAGVLLLETLRVL